MQDDWLADMVRIGNAADFVVVATADQDGLPHVAIGSEIALELQPGPRVFFSDWLSVRTANHLAANPRISVAVWTQADGAGWQLRGQVEDIREIAMVDGPPLEEELRRPMPQVKRRLTIRPEDVLPIRRSPPSEQTV